MVRAFLIWFMFNYTERHNFISDIFTICKYLSGRTKITTKRKLEEKINSLRAVLVR